MMLYLQYQIKRQIFLIKMLKIQNQIIQKENQREQKIEK